MGASSAALVVARAAIAGNSRRPRREQLRYLQPATLWNEALPIGNGRLGAMVFGRVAQERLQLNEDTLWAGSPYTPDNPEALAAIPEVRRLLAAGDYRAATALAGEKVMARPLRQMAYGSLGDVLIDFENAQAPSEYERILDLATAVTSARYRTGSGEFSREAFASAADDVIVWRTRASEHEHNLEIRYRAPDEDAVDMEVRVAPDGEGAMLVTGRNWENSGIAAGLTFALRLKVIADGQVEVSDGRMRIRKAREIVVLLAAATSYVDFRNVSGDPLASVRRATNEAARKRFAALKRAHVREYQALYKSASLELASTQASSLPTDVRIANAENGDDPALAALYFQFARYLLISSSRAGCQPANLQGIWNEGINPPWGSKYTININTEMNYWPANAAGLSACVEPLLRMVEQLAQTGARTAKTMYGARGWVAHHNTDLWRAAAPIDGPMWGLWPCGGAWLCNTLWDHYDYTRSAATLARLYPLMRDASLFFLDTLIEDPKGRGLVTSPSLSPENTHPFGSSLCVGPAMDRQILRDLFAHTIEAGQVLQTKDPLLEELRRAQQRLAPDTIGQRGQLQEWLEDWDGAAPDPHHRHVSHLYAVYPSSQINVRDTLALVEAAKVSLNTRGDLATGWGTAWRLCLWARLGEGEHAHRILEALLGPDRTYPNMFDAHPPFQIDGNFGGAAGILEMIVQSWGEELRLLPALPKAWASGAVRGIHARGGLRLDMDWRSGEVEWFELNGPANASVNVRVRGEMPRRISLDARGRYRHARGGEFDGFRT
ncbi:MAG TPA: glycoside hydrolase family 95 protein [Steroidobacteraceae bacterium]|nr:glycoside hydrolase family 95 protein [Steroidobacteraceae bacterium]